MLVDVFHNGVMPTFLKQARGEGKNRWETGERMRKAGSNKE